MKETVARFLWVDGSLSSMERLCLTSFLDVGCHVELFAYGVVSGVPRGVKVRDAREILPENRVFLSPGVAGPSYANFADLFRYTMLYRFGGWWFDMDFVALKRPCASSELLFASTWENEWKDCANNCVIYAEPEDRSIRFLRDEAEGA